MTICRLQLWIKLDHSTYTVQCDMLLICSISATCNVIHNVGADHKRIGCSRSRLRGGGGQLFHRRITIHTSQLSHHSQRGVTINASHSAPITASNIAHQTSQQLQRLTSEVATASKQQSQGYLTLSTLSIIQCK